MNTRLNIIIVFLLIATFLVGCAQSSSEENNDGVEAINTMIDNRILILDSEKDTVLVYFSSEDGKHLVPITLPINPTEEAVKVSIEKILGGPGDWFLSKTTPEGTKLRGIYIKNNITYVDLTSHFKNFEEYEDVRIAINSLVLAVTEFPEIEAVQFLIEGVIVEDINGFRLNKPFKRPAYINALTDIDEENKPIHVYFSDPNTLYLVPIGFGINKDSTTIQMLDSAMQELLKGPPQNSDLIKTIWPNTRLINISYDSENSLATINLSKETVGYGEGAVAEMLFIKSILFTVTSIDGVDWVQILIEEDIIDHLPEGIDISSPLERPEYINFISP